MRSLLLPCFFLFFACAHEEKQKPTKEVTAATPLPGSRYTTLVFPTGSAELDVSNKEALKDFTHQVRARRKKIEDIKILAWADQEYPNRGRSKGSTREVILAAERAQHIKDYLLEDLHEKNEVDTFNMAKKPGHIDKFFKDEEYQVKKAYEDSGVTGALLPDGTISYTKASKALVIIKYQGEKSEL